MSGISEENSATQVADVIKAVCSIREVKPGASSIIVHHTNAGGLKARGSTAMKANVDYLWMLQKDAGGSFQMSSRSEDGGKSKDEAPEVIKGLKLVSHLQSAIIQWTGKEAESPHWPLIRDALQEGPKAGADLRQACGIAEAKGPEYDAWKAYMASLVRAETITRSGPTTRPVYLMLPMPGQ